MKRTRAIKSWSKHNLPDELWPEILSRIPVKSLLRFRCVTKSWRSLIDDPNFCRLHLNSFKNNSLETHLLIDQHGANEHCCVVRCNKTFKTTMRFDTLDTSGGCIRTLPIKSTYSCNEMIWFVICSVDGLVLLWHSQPTHELILWNPSIRRARTLHVARTSAEEYVDLGFGFNPLLNDYKHVRFVPRGENSLGSIAVYTVGIRSWRTIPFQDAGGSNWRWTFQHSFSWRSVCCKGILYFTPRTIISDDRELVSFDLSTEVFASTSLPIEEADPFSNQTLALVEGGCSLGCVKISPTNGSIWVLENSGPDNHSMHWTKRYTFGYEICPSEYHRLNFLYVKKNGEMLLQRFKKQVTSYNLETQEENTLVMNGRGLEMIMVWGYMESLVLLNG